jgi:hypothetical protein
MAKDMDEFSDECKAYFNGSVGERDAFRAMKGEYTSNMHNTGYMVANILKWGGAWAFFVYLGQEQWQDIDLDITIASTLSKHTFESMVFLMAFLFGSNLNKFIYALDHWEKCLTDLRHLALYLLAHQQDKMGKVEKSKVLDIICDAYTLIVTSKYQAAISRQDMDWFGTQFCGFFCGVNTEASFSPPNLALHRKEFYNTCTVALEPINNPNKMAKVDAIIKDSYNAQHAMCAPNVANAVIQLTGILLCVVSMLISSEQKDMWSAFVVTGITVGTIAVPFSVSASVCVGSFSLASHKVFMIPIDDDLKETLSLLKTMLSGKASVDRKPSSSHWRSKPKSFIEL